MLRQRIFTFIGIGLAALILVSAALAGTITATATVTGAGSIALSNGATASISDTLDGTDQTVGYTVPLNLTDARGSGAGWNLTLTSTTFNDGAGQPSRQPLRRSPRLRWPVLAATAARAPRTRSPTR